MIHENPFLRTFTKDASGSPIVNSNSADDASAVGGPPPYFQPVWVREVEIGQALPALSTVDTKTGQRYQRGMFIVRLHTQILGMVELRLDKDTLSAEELAHYIWFALKPSINDHLREDGLPIVDDLTPSGLPYPAIPWCLKLRHEVLASPPFVSIIVATRDRPESLTICLESLLSLEYSNYEIVVVDNAPQSNATFDLIRGAYGHLPQIRYVREDHPGLAIAHNRGLVDVRASIVAFTDDDVVVDRYWLVELVQGFLCAENVGCVTGSILPAELETPAQVWFEQYGGFCKGFARRVFEIPKSRSNNPLFPYTAGAFGTGANMAFAASALKAVGGFDPALGAGTTARGGDDLAAFFKIVTSGYRLVYQPNALIYHSHRREYTALRRQAFGYGVGLTAFLTKSLLDRPQYFFDFITRIPYGLIHLFSAESPKNAKKAADYPPDLTTLERKGMLCGPICYLRSHWEVRKMRPPFVHATNDATTPTSVISAPNGIVRR